MIIMAGNAKYSILNKDKLSGKILSTNPAIYTIILETKEDYEKIDKILEELL